MIPRTRLAFSLVVFLELALITILVSPRLTRSEPMPMEKGQTRRVDGVGDPLPESAVARLGSVRLVDPSGPRALAFAPDGKILVSGGLDGKIRLWDAATGKPRGRLDGHESAVEVLTFSPDGKILASAPATQNDQKIRLWDTSTWKAVRTLPGHRNGTSTLLFSPNGKTLYSAGDDGTLCLWDVVAGKELLRFSPHAQKTPRGALSPDGRVLFTGGASEPEIRLWDPLTGKKLRHVQVPPGGVRALAVSHDGKTLAAACFDRQVRLWDIASGTEKRRWALSQAAESVAFAPTDKWVAAGTWKGLVHVWDTSSGEEETHRLPCTAGLAFAPDHNILALGYGSWIRLWDLGVGKELFRPLGHRAGIKTIVSSLDGTLTTVGLDDTVRVWDSATGKEKHCLEDLRPAYWTAGLTPDERIFALGLPDGDGCLFDSESGKELYRFKMGKGRVQTACSADGKILATLLPPATIIFVDVLTGEELRRVHADVVVKGITLSPDATTLATTSAQGADLWDSTTGDKIHHLNGPAGLAVAFFPDGKALAVGENLYKIRLWDVASGRPLRQLNEVGLSGFAKIKIAPGGRALAAVGIKGELTLWDTLTGKLLAQNKDKNNPRRPFAFTPDGLKLALGWEDQSVRLWDAITGQEIRRFHGHEDEVSAVAFSTDSRRLISGGLSGTGLIWDVVAPGVAAASPRELPSLYEDLGGADAVRADRAFWSLAASPEQAVALARSRLSGSPPKGPSPRRLLIQLDDDDFDKREKAQLELTRLAGKAERALRAAVEENPTPEVRRRVQEILERLERQPLSLAPLPRATLRLLRALEQAGTPEARAILNTLADGIDDLALANEAHDALSRSKNKRASRP